MKKPLFIFEMANNHMGDLYHGKKIVQELKKITNDFQEFDFAVKLQLRDDSFFHPSHIHRQDHKLIKRFVETRLGDKFVSLIDEIKKNNYIAMCTPWDEIATEFLIKINIDIIKVASCSFNDWSLLESISRHKKRIIASTAGATKIEIDKVYSFFKNKLSDFAFMHCVGEYPTPDENLHLNQIEYLRNNYQDIEIGYSTHEKPDNYLPISIAIAKGATIFEKHVGIKNEEYNINDYSATPEMCKNWLEAARKTYKILGPFVEKRKNFSDKETSDLRILYRGVYAKNDLTKNHIISDNDFFLSMPNIDSQLVAKDMGKFIKYSTKVDIKKNQAIMIGDVIKDNLMSEAMDQRYLIKDMTKLKIFNSKVIIPKDCKVEISHHNGIENFFKVGAVLFHLINKEYSKILVIMFPGQKYPAHYHERKNETYLIIDGDLTVNIDNKLHNLKKGDLFTVKNQIIHSFETNSGVIFEEIATSYIPGDSKYIEEVNSNRKTPLNIFE